MPSTLPPGSSPPSPGFAPCAILICNSSEEHKDDDTWFYDALHEVIDCYVSRYDEEAREVVEKYGVFKAIKDYENEYGEFEIDKCENCNYMKLYYHLIYDFIMENYREKLESPPTEDE